MAVLALLTTPGPMAEVPQLMPARWAIGPLTRIIGASVWPDTCMSRWFSSGWARQSMAASNMGNCSGRQPAITALIATFSTVATPKPGSITISTSWGLRLVPASIRSTSSGVGGITGMPSLQSRSARKRFTESSPSGEASISTVNTSVAPPLPWMDTGPRSVGKAVRPWIMVSTCPSTMLRMKSVCWPVVAWGMMT